MSDQPYFSLLTGSCAVGSHDFGSSRALLILVGSFARAASTDVIPLSSLDHRSSHMLISCLEPVEVATDYNHVSASHLKPLAAGAE